MNENIEQPTQDREFAKKAIEDRNNRDNARHKEISEKVEHLTGNVANLGVNMEETRANVAALRERLDPTPPTAGFAEFLYNLDSAVRKAAPYVVVAGGVAGGVAAGVKGVQAAKAWWSKPKSDAATTETPQTAS